MRRPEGEAALLGRTTFTPDLAAPAGESVGGMALDLSSDLFAVMILQKGGEGGEMVQEHTTRNNIWWLVMCPDQASP